MPNDALQVALTNYTFWLVIVGALQVAGLLLQAGFLFRAFRATEKAAKANTDTVRVALEAQRAIIVANVRDPIMDFNVGKQPLVGLHIKNFGATGAYESSYETWIEVVKSPFVDFTPAADYFKPPHRVAIHPRNPVPLAVSIELKHPLTAQEAVDISQHQTRQLCFRIRLEWTDAFGDAHWANFGLCYNGQQVGTLPRYNDAG